MAMAIDAPPCTRFAKISATPAANVRAMMELAKKYRKIISAAAMAKAMALFNVLHAWFFLLGNKTLIISPAISPSSALITKVKGANRG